MCGVGAYDVSMMGVSQVRREFECAEAVAAGAEAAITIIIIHNNPSPAILPSQSTQRIGWVPPEVPEGVGWVVGGTGVGIRQHRQEVAGVVV